MTAVPALTAVVYAASTRLVKVAPARLTLGWTAFGLAVLAALVAPTYLPPTNLPTVVGCASVIVAVLLLPNTDRVAPMTWTAWVALAPLTFSLLSAGFDRFDRLDPTRAWSSVLVGVGGAMLLIGTAVDLRDRGWVTRLLPARPLLLPVMVVGAAEVVLSQALALAVPRDPGGWLMVAGAVVVLGVALLLRVGSLSCVALVLGWFGAVRLSFERVETSPWIAVTVATALLVVAEILHRALADRTWWSRWDLPVLVSAAPVATTALWAAADGDGFSWTYFSVGLMCAVVAGRLYRTVEASASLAGVGTVLMFTGTANAGPGWVALLLLAYAVGCTAAAMVAAAPWKYVLQLGGAVLALASWLAALAWLDWSDQRSFDVTVAVAGAVTLLAAGVALSRRLHPSWVWAWGGTATAVTGSAVVAVADAASGLDTSITVVLSWYAVAGLAAVAVATAIAAEPLASGWLRELAVAFGLVSLLTAFDVVDATSTAGVAVLGAVSVVLGIAALTPLCSDARPAARRAVLELGAATAVLAVGFSWDELPDRDLLVASLAVAAVQAASAGIALRSVALQSCAPVLACASWVVFASQAVNADAQWFTVPIGAALLAVVTLWRRDRRSRSAPVASPEIVAVELVGIAFLVGSSFVQTFTTSVGYAALAAVIGLLLVGWGLVTRVRRRLLAGALVTVGGVVLLVMVPLVRLLPAWQGAWMWILVVVVGLLALGAASLLESGRSMVRTGRRRFVDLTGGWE
jgi:hypothetical protein